jgi:hypothetical protein
MDGDATLFGPLSARVRSPGHLSRRWTARVRAASPLSLRERVRVREFRCRKRLIPHPDPVSGGEGASRRAVLGRSTVFHRTRYPSRRRNVRLGGQHIGRFHPPLLTPSRSFRAQRFVWPVGGASLGLHRTPLAREALDPTPL